LARWFAHRRALLADPKHRLRRCLIIESNHLALR